jgi:hypothetical protein
MTPSVYPLIVGMLAAGYLTAAMFFLRFWRRSGDRLFLLFALAFALMSAQRIASILTTQWTESASWTYLLRLVAYLLILAAIIDKNRPAATRG